MGLAFGAHFLYDYSIKMFLIYGSINGQRFNAIPFFFLKISNKMCYQVLIQTVDDVINSKIYLGSSSKAMADREKKRGRWKYKNFNILRTKKSFLNAIKTFSQFLKGYHLVKNKNLLKNSRQKLEGFTKYTTSIDCQRGALLEILN